MNRYNERQLKKETLTQVLSKISGKNIIDASYQTKQLQGGTLGEVWLVTGMAEAADGLKLPYKVVLKIQKKWERYGDPDSWRREYDLYRSELGKVFTDSFRWPECYFLEIKDEEIQIWMEYIDGISGLDLTGEMYERAAEEIGRFQGRLYAEQPTFFRNLNNLSSVDYAKNYYLHYRSWEVVYNYIRSDECDIPRHLCRMLIDLDENADEIFSRIEKLPKVLCHRDFWVANIFYSDDKIRIIDWDTAGWGYLGEDLASLIADEADVEHMVDYYHRCIPAYYKGFSEYADLSHITDSCIREIILIMFGYRLIEWYMFAESSDTKTQHLKTLQKIYEFEGIQMN